MENHKYILSPLTYGYGELVPFLSEEQVRIHYEKHHQAYVNGANAILDKLDQARTNGNDLDLRAVLKEFSFQLAGHILHAYFWDNIAPAGKRGGGEPTRRLAEKIAEHFGSLTRFKKEFAQTAASVEGSGWAVVTYCPHTGRLLLTQIEKHNVNLIPAHPILLVLDVFEHAYYLDYMNDRVRYIEAFWNNVNWANVSERLEKAHK